MTFNQAEVVDVISFSNSIEVPLNTVANIYTVPAGKYGIFYLYRTASDATFSFKINISGSRKSAPTFTSPIDGQPQVYLLKAGDKFEMSADSGTTVTSSPVNFTALLFNLP